MSYRLAESLRILRDEEINVRWPDRDKRSDGWIGDAAHASRNSDHNPYIKDDDGVGVVRALDIDEDGIDGPWLAEHFRLMGQAGDPRIRYVIYEGRIASSREKWKWRPYTGPNAHKHHIHLSVVEAQSGYDYTEGWGVLVPVQEEDPLAAITEERFAALEKQVADIHRQFTVSVPDEMDGKGHSTKAGTLRWRLTTILNRTADIAAGRRG